MGLKSFATINSQYDAYGSPYGSQYNPARPKEYARTAVLFYWSETCERKTALHTCLVQKLKLLRRRLLIFRFGFVRVVHRRQLPVALLNLIRRGLEEKKSRKCCIKKGKQWTNSRGRRGKHSPVYARLAQLPNAGRSSASSEFRWLTSL